MDQFERLALMAEALGTLAGSDVGGEFVIFEDRNTRDYVQFMVVPFLNEPVARHVRLPLTTDWSIPKVQWEVTDRGLHTGGPLPGMSPLSPVQVATITEDGFALSNHPNFTAYIDLRHVDAIARECEHLFDILGSPPGFALGVTVGGGERAS